MTRSWDIFCSVVDNFGDIGVCWRLARQLSSDLGQTVRLWVDDLESFRRICSEVDAKRDVQRVGTVEVRRWRDVPADVAPADVVIEGFGVRLPDTYVATMAARMPQPVWINLEHLSAESWVEGCHGLPSPHARLPLVKYFYFPGFTARTGGLLLESGLIQARDAFQSDAGEVARFWQKLGVAAATATTLRTSLFCYENAALPALVAAWSLGSAPVLCVVPAGGVLDQLSAIVGRSVTPGTSVEQGRLTIAAIPFLDIDQYDHLLWACDVNFVRGEDSFVRAQLAARPLVWQAYVQEEGAHLAKQDAFLDLYTDGLDAGVSASIRALHGAWNHQSPSIKPCWETFTSMRPAAEAHAREWAARLTGGGNLAIGLAEFCQDRLE